jgi:hypothetical protein
MLQPVEFLVGEWEGAGRGMWAGGFEFRDTLRFWHDGRPILSFREETFGPDGRPSHGECGYLVAQATGDFHMTVAEPSGITEVLVGRATGTTIELESAEIGHSPTTDNVTAVRRILSIENGTLVAEVHLSVDGEPLAPHTRSELSRTTSR